jgi:hypothetical protein
VWAWLSDLIADAVQRADVPDERMDWICSVTRTLARRRDAAPHLVHTEIHRQWAADAVAAGYLAWAPSRRDAVVLSELWAQEVRRTQAGYDDWVRGVHAAAAREPYPISSEQEAAWAKIAVAERVLAWEVEGVTLVPAKTGDGGGAPYR